MAKQFKNVGIVYGMFKTQDMTPEVKKFMYALQENCSTELILEYWQKAFLKTQGYGCMVSEAIEDLVEHMVIERASGLTGKIALDLRFEFKSNSGDFAVAMENFFKVFAKYRYDMRKPGMMYCLRNDRSTSTYHFFTGIYNKRYPQIEHKYAASLIQCPLYKEYDMEKLFGGVAGIVQEDSLK